MQKRTCRGFTLIELMVVVVIIGLLSAIVVVGIDRAIADARLETARTQMAQIGGAVEMFRLTKHRYPDDLATLTAADRTGEPFIRHIPADPWNGEYGYAVVSKRRYEIRCAGEDGDFGTEDDLVHPIVIRPR